MITYVNPAVAALLGVAILDEHFTVAMGLGFVLVLAGLGARHPARDRAPGRARGPPSTRPPRLFFVELRDLPSVDELAGARVCFATSPAPSRSRPPAPRSARAREEIRAGHDPGDLGERAVGELAAATEPRLRRVLNATGVIVHTNLGRAPLAEAALARVAEVGGSYSNLEYDLDAGARGSRQDHVAGLLRRVTGAEAALVVNNNAAAVLLALAALAEGREVLVSRGELIEIGDGFRIPGRARAVGRAARRGRDDEPHAGGGLRARDRAETRRCFFASTSRTSASSASPSGRPRRPLPTWPEEPAYLSWTTLAPGALAASNSVLLADEPSPRSALVATAPTSSASRATSCSAGRRLGSSSGRADLVERLRRHPLQRALRADKLTLAALEGTLALHLDPIARAPRGAGDCGCSTSRTKRSAHGPRGSPPRSAARSRRRSRAWAAAPSAAGAPSFACAVEEELAVPLRGADPPVIAIVRDGRTLLDCRTLSDAEAGEVAAAVLACRSR